MSCLVMLWVYHSAKHLPSTSETMDVESQCWTAEQSLGISEWDSFRDCCATAVWDSKARSYFNGNTQPTPTQDSAYNSFMWHALQPSVDLNTSWRWNSWMVSINTPEPGKTRNRQICKFKPCSSYILHAPGRPQLPMYVFWRKAATCTSKINSTKRIAKCFNYDLKKNFSDLSKRMESSEHCCFPSAKSMTKFTLMLLGPRLDSAYC